MATMKEILHTADGIGDTPMEVHEQCAHAEVVELLELVQQDWTFHDLDEYDHEYIQTVHGSIVLGLMKRCETMTKALQAIVDDNEFCKASFRSYGDRGREYAKTAKQALD